MKKLISAFILIVLGGLVWFFIFSSTAETPGTENSSNDQTTQQATIPPQTTQNSTTIAEDVVVEELQYSIDDADSLWVVVNKSRPISKTYVPANLVDVDVTKREDKSRAELQLRSDAAEKLEDLFAAAESEKFELLLSSAYRSAELQAFYYNNYVEAYGQDEADTFSAKPGTSEHQIGLSADIHATTKECYLQTCFGDTAEGQWLAQNAHLYGFIIRYPEGKEAITTYQYEPWHFRYVGEELALELFSQQTTLEEYFEL